MIRHWVVLAALTVSLPARGNDTNSLIRTTELVRAGSIVTLPGLVIHGGDKKFIEATGKISLADGEILEFVAVEPKGRDYESLLTLDCRPSALQFALLLIGCEAGARPHAAKPGEKTGTPLAIELEWRRAGQTHRVPVETLLVDRHTKTAPKNMPWIFTGSYFTKSVVDGRQIFQSDEEQAFVALWWSPSIIINLDSDFGNPYRGEEQGFAVNSKTVPPKDTPIKLILRLR
jgi:hypothetical protein